ncbi:MAG: transcription antitermination factor NusB [Pseudomonadota bacterium]
MNSPQNSRNIAFKILNEILFDYKIKDNVLCDLSTEIEKLPKQDISFLYELVHGVLRWKLRLDFMISHCIELTKIQAKLLNILRIGFYQLYFMNVKNHAAINETVNLLSNKKQKGFVNAILRKSQRLCFDYKNLGDERTSVLFSMPRWIVDKLNSDFSHLQAIKILSYLLKRPSHSMRIDTDYEVEIEKALKNEGIEFSKSALSKSAYFINSQKHPLIKKFIDDGKIYIQDIGSQIVVDCLDPKNDDVIWDVFAGVGGKSFHIRQKACKATILASDKDKRRSSVLKEFGNNDSAFLGVKADVFKFDPMVELRAFNKKFEGKEKRVFSKILIDAPCSGIGTISKNPDLKWRIKKDDISALAQIQLNSLLMASKYLKPGGQITYSLCTFNFEETDAVINQFLKLRREFNINDNYPKAMNEFKTNKGYLRLFPYQTKQSGYFIANLYLSSGF